MTQPQDQDPFAEVSRPAISFNNAPFGTTYIGTVIDLPKKVQSRDFATGKPAFYDDGNPKMSVVLGIRQANGEENSVWAGVPSNLFSAIANAQKEAGSRISLGGTLTITLTGERPNDKDPKLNAIKLYEARYTPADPLADTGAAPAAAPATAAPAAPAAAAPAAAPAASPATPAAAAPPAASPAAIGEQIKVLLGAGMTDSQIANVPAVAQAGTTVGAIAAVRAAQGLPPNP